MDGKQYRRARFAVPRGSLLFAATAAVLLTAFAAPASAGFGFVRSWGQSPNDPGKLSTAFGSVADSAGNIFVIDNGGANRVEQFSATGEFIREFGRPGTGEGEFMNPVGIAVDGSDNVYVTDLGNARVQKFNSSGEFLLAWGWGVQDGSPAAQICTSGCQAGIPGVGAGQLDSPTGLAISSDGDVYISDNKIKKFTTAGVYQGDFGESGSAAGELGGPIGLAINRSTDNLYVVEQSNSRISQFDASDQFVRAWGAGVVNGTPIHQICTAVCQAGVLASGAGALFAPVGITVDASGHVFVGDQSNNRIQKFQANGNFISTWGWGVQDGSHALQTCSAGCQAGVPGEAPGQLNSPTWVSVLTGGGLYVSSAPSHRIDQFTDSGSFIRSWGAVDPTAHGNFRTPGAVALDGDGRVYVADTGNDRIEVFGNRGNYLTSFGTSGPGQLDSPRGVAVASDGSVYVSDTDHSRIVKFSRQGLFQLAWGSAGSGDGQFGLVLGLAVAPSGAVLAVDLSQNRVQQFTPTGEFVRKWGSLGGGIGQFASPFSIAASSSGVYVSDVGNNRVQRFAADGAFKSEWGSPGADDGEFALPIGVTTGPDGAVYVVDAINGTVQKFTPEGDFIARFGAPGSEPGQLDAPFGAAVDCRGNVFVVEASSFGRISVFGDPTSAPPPCLGDGGDGGALPGPGPDAELPALSLKLAPATFRTKARSSKRAPAGRRKRAKVGTTLEFTLSEAARVKFSVQMYYTGRTVRGRCRPDRPTRAKGKRCGGYKSVGDFSHDGREGSNRQVFSGKLGNRRLAEGSYRLIAIASDAAGNRSAEVTSTFKVLR